MTKFSGKMNLIRWSHKRSYTYTYTNIVKLQLIPFIGTEKAGISNKYS